MVISCIKVYINSVISIRLYHTLALSKPTMTHISVPRHFFDPVHGSVLKGCIYYFKIAVSCFSIMSLRQIYVDE
jgi:hypothetical protein